jgi:hypothetical protein
MPDTMHLETTLDDAEKRLKALRARVAVAKAAMQAAVEPFISDLPLHLRIAERRRAHDYIEDMLADLVWNEQTEIENEKVAAENAIAPIDDADLRLNAPVVL